LDKPAAIGLFLIDGQAQKGARSVCRMRSDVSRLKAIRDYFEILLNAFSTWRLARLPFSGLALACTRQLGDLQHEPQAGRHVARTSAC
jgi:ABC-type uncharacterized transport system permease subunit